MTILTAANVRVGSGDRDGRLNREVFVDWSYSISVDEVDGGGKASARL